MLTAQLFDASGNLVVDALLTDISNFTYTERLDEIGTYSLQMPLANVYGKAYVDQASTIAISEDFTEFFRGTVNRISRAEGTFRVQGNDLLEELRYPETGVSSVFNNEPLPDVIDELVALSNKGWTAVVTAQSLGVTTSYQGRQVLDAIRDLIRTYGLHMRRTSPSARTIEIAAFGADNGYVLTNAPNLAHTDMIRTASFVGPINTDTDRTQMVNRVVAYGGTYGSTILKLPLSNRVQTSTVVVARTIDGQIEHYIENANSVVTYGAREKVVAFSDIVPASTDATDVARAEDMLKTRAVAFLDRWSNPIVAHEIQTANFNRSLARVGDLVTLHYEERIGDTVVSENGTYYITQVSGNFTNTGQTMYTLFLSDSNRVQTDDREALLSALQRIEELKLADLS